MTRVLFLTGTLAPAAGTPLLARSAVADRIADYRRALDFQLGVLARGAVDRLVFVENSGHGMHPFADQVAASGLADRVELISYAAPPVPPGGSRLEAEFHLILHGLAAARSLAGLPPETVVWKITGRYVLRNIETIMDRAPPGRDAHFHCRDWPRPHVDFAHAGYALGRAEAVIGALLQGPMGTGYMAWARAAMARGTPVQGPFAGLRLSLRFGAIPRLSGWRGVDGASWDGPGQRARHALRVAAAAVAPRLWI